MQTTEPQHENNVVHLTGYNYHEVISPFITEDYDETIALVAQRICDQFEQSHLLPQSTNLIDVEEASKTETIISTVSTKFQTPLHVVQQDITDIAQFLIDSLEIKYGIEDVCIPVLSDFSNVVSMHR